MVSGNAPNRRHREIDWIGIVSIVIGLAILLATLAGWRS